ncbi:MAG: DUF2357 domain-containing protein [Mesorhizobium sp.]|uniref:DUF2357 domain-containing protein n=1 Tax=Mesorhizobium sp. TaxID=1871066 RepID=UPI000FE8FA6E|nr:DUF2357 domain-containing protein [Mesorhizobium sp.]RWK87959.1 MAG: DUF2357 domain-containing protein [Mesorhizobium sp.]
MTIELWHRPWALVDMRRRHRQVLAPGAVVIDANCRAPLWLYSPQQHNAFDSAAGIGEPVEGFSPTNPGRSLLHLPLPLRRSQSLAVHVAGGIVKIGWPTGPERPPSTFEPQTEEELAAHQLMLRAEAVWDRLNDVETALADPARLWQELRRRWTEKDEDIPPRMDLIVRHAITLSRTLDELDRAPRRILRRVHQQVPVSRVQELDRRAMTWLVRQPGDTLAERAGDRQRVLAVAREENFDTLENRVLRSYAELAWHVARDYLERNASRRHTSRASKVREFERRCKRLARDLADRGVRLAEPGMTPNFVLQQNPRYHAIWNAWQELRDRERVLDELWRWQARSWEEFCALAVMVALVGVPGARLISSAPVSFLDEQRRGSWIAHDNPLAVFHLPQQRIVVEVRYRMANPTARLRDFAAPIWIRIGRVGDAEAFLENVAVWPVWDISGGAVDDEAEEVAQILPLGRLAGALVLRPAIFGGSAVSREATKVLTATIGTEGTALSDGVAAVTRFLSSLITAEAG